MALKDELEVVAEHVEGDGSSDGARFPPQCGEIVHDVQLPAVQWRALMLAHDLAAVADLDGIAVQQGRHLLAHEMVRHGVMDLADDDGPVFVNGVIPLLEASHLAHQRQHTPPFLFYLLLRTSPDDAQRCVEFAAGIGNLHLCGLDGLKGVHPAEGCPPHHFHASLHMPLLVAPVGIAETMREAVCGLQPHKSVGRVLPSDEVLHCHPHVVVDHAVRHMPQLSEEQPV